MSDAVRSYRRGSLPAEPPATPPRFGYVKNTAQVVALLVVLFVIYAAVSTRDNRPYENFIAGENSYHVNVYDLLKRREAWADSPVWSSLPDPWIAKDVPARLRDNYGFPEWMVRNFIGRHVYITGNDSKGFGDAVVITRMTSVGCLLERGLRWTPRFRSDDAGGLNLEYIEDDGLYYAIRGRTLLMSSDRGALIAALTLDPDRRIESTVPAYGPDRGLIEGRFRPSGGEHPFSSFTSLELKFDHDGLSWNAAVAGVLTDEMRAVWQPVMAGSSQEGLLIPVDGAAVLSMRTGAPLRELWPALGSLSDLDIFSAEQWHGWETADPAESYATALLDVVGPIGEGVAVSWNGFDVNAQSPAPLFTTLLSHSPGELESVLGNFSPEPPGAAFLPAYVRYDAENQRATFFGKGGPAWTPTLQLFDRFSVLASGDRALAAIDGDEGSLGRKLEGADNVYFSMNPQEAVEHLVAAGSAWAAHGMLADMTDSEFEKEAARWREKASALDAVSLIGDYDEGTLNVTIQIQEASR